MPVIFSISPIIRKNLAGEVAQLIKRQTIQLPPTENDRVTIAAIINIQQLKSYDAVEIKTSAPEGYRVLLAEGTHAIAAADFYYGEERLEFAQLLPAASLDEFINALNAVEVMYRDRKVKWAVAQLEFIPAPQPYLAVYTRSRTRLFTYRGQQLLKITKKELTATLRELKASRQSITTVEKQ